MRFAARLLLAAGLGAALCAPVAAAPSTTLLDELRFLIQARHDTLSPEGSEGDVLELAALTRALQAFDLPSHSLYGDVRIFARAAKAVERAGTTEVIRQAVETTLFDLRAAVLPDRDALAARIDALVAPRTREAAEATLADIDASMNSAVAGAGTPSYRAKTDLRFAIARISALNARIDRATAPRGGPARPGRAYVACLLDDTPFVPRFGGSAAGADGGADSRVSVTGYGSARQPALEISWDTGAFTGAGTYGLDGTSGALIVLVADGVTFMSDSGSVVVTAFDPVRRRISGTFSGTVAAESGGHRALSSGTFAAAYAISTR